MEKFFIEQYTFEKKAGKILSNNQLQWPKEILEELYKKFPSLAGVPQSLNYSAKNDEKGSAFGEVMVGKICVPFIIDNYELKSLMVAHLQGEDVTASMPLTNTLIDRVLFNKGFDKKLVSKQDMQKSPVSYSGSYIKSASLTDQLNGTVHEEDIKEVLTTLRDPKIQDAVKKNSSIVEKVAGLTTVKSGKLSSNVEDNVEYIFKESSLGWTKLTGSTEVYSPSKTILKEAGASGESFKTASANKIGILKKASPSNVISYDGNDYKVVGMDSRFSPVSTMLVSSNGNYITDLEKAAEWDYSDKDVTFSNKNLSSKDTVLVKVDDSFVGPVKIASVYDVKGKTNIHGETNFEKISFVENPLLAKSSFDSKTRTMYVPSIETIKVASKVYVKSPTQKTANHSITVRNDEYILQGPEFNKYASLSNKTNPYTKNEAIWALLQVGASEDTVKEASACKRGVIKIKDQLSAPISKSASVDSEANDIAYLRSYIDSNFRGMVKEAASITDPNALDTVLGLNLVNEDNILVLLENINIIDATLNILSRLWLLACAGLKPFNTSPIEFVIEKLSTIRQTLETLSYLVDKK